MSPFRLMCKVTGYGIMAATAVCLILASTSHSASQLVMVLVVYVLSILLAVAVGFYVACKYQMNREDEWQANALYSIHYPLTMEFEAKKNHVDKQLHKYYRPSIYKKAA